MKVDYNGVISAINLSSGYESIDASKINLNGAVTANNYFKINLDGSVESVKGTFDKRKRFGSDSKQRVCAVLYKKFWYAKVRYGNKVGYANRKYLK